MYLSASFLIPVLGNLGGAIKMKRLLAATVIAFALVLVPATASASEGLWPADYQPTTSECGSYSLDANNFCYETTDGPSVELGVKFTASRDLNVVGIRAYRTDAGPVTGSLWDTEGTRLAGPVSFGGTATHSWQDAMFAAPVPITAGQTYIASYYAPNADYAFAWQYFTNSSYTAGPITAQQSVAGIDENGVYIYGSSAFPTESHRDSNYWVSPLWEEEGKLNVRKFYDANANGAYDQGEGDQYIEGWKVNINDGEAFDVFTPASVMLYAGDYEVTEYDPLESNWFHTTDNPVDMTLEGGDNKTVEFGNLCVGAGGGLTKGFWSNKNGEKLGEDDLSLLRDLNLVEEDGSAFDPAKYTEVRSWLKQANAVNMAYMLSAQLATMELNVANGKVDGGALIDAPGTESANELGFATVSDVMKGANEELGEHHTALSGEAWRSYQQTLKSALENANSNYTFVQPEPCPFSFAEE
jgi:hypothetical protein